MLKIDIDRLLEALPPDPPRAAGPLCVDAASYAVAIGSTRDSVRRARWLYRHPSYVRAKRPFTRAEGRRFYAWWRRKRPSAV